VLRVTRRAISQANIQVPDMTRFFKSLRRGRGDRSRDHRQVFAEFAMTLMYLRAEMAVKTRRARLRVVG
jgi:hypothetical protein